MTAEDMLAFNLEGNSLRIPWGRLSRSRAASETSVGDAGRGAPGLRRRWVVLPGGRGRPPPARPESTLLSPAFGKKRIR